MARQLGLTDLPRLLPVLTAVEEEPTCQAVRVEIGRERTVGACLEATFRRVWEGVSAGDERRVLKRGIDSSVLSRPRRCV